MTRRSRGLAGLGLVVGAMICFTGPTAVERRARAAQASGPAAEPAVARHIDRDRVMEDVTRLASAEFAGRQTGTAGGLKARAWVVEQFAAARLEPAGRDGYLQPFQFTHESGRGVRGRQPARTEYRDAANVIGRLNGTDPSAAPIVLSAHYDHLGTQNGAVYPGADDNASGIAVLLASARYFAENRPRRSLVFAAFDAEELGLHGARAFVASGLLQRRAAVNVNLDMVSRNDRNEIFAVGTYHYPQLKPLLDDVQSRASVRILFGHDRPQPTARRGEDWTYLSDHAPFHEAGIPFIYFGVDYHRDYHRPTDTADKIDRLFIGAVADMVVETLRTFDRRLP